MLHLASVWTPLSSADNYVIIIPKSEQLSIAHVLTSIHTCPLALLSPGLCYIPCNTGNRRSGLSRSPRPLRSCLPPHPGTTTSRGGLSIAPSDEFLIVARAKDAAKREAEAAGGDKRPRLPSRRALEASGVLTDAVLQRVIREKEENQTRAAALTKARRKDAKAKGLKYGTALEVVVG